MLNILPFIIYSLFIYAINSLSTPKKAYKGNIFAIISMVLAISLSLFSVSTIHIIPVIFAITFGGIIGIVSAHKIQMQNLPQMVAILNGLGGLCSGLIGVAELETERHLDILSLLIIGVGFLTFSGSLAVFLKLNNINKLIDDTTLRSISAIIFILALVSGIYAYSGEIHYILGFIILTNIFGFIFVLPIGGADTPIIISLLNALSGWCTVLIGFDDKSPLLIIVGTLVGSSGLILSYIMTKAMNRSIFKVLFHSITNNQIISNQEKTAIIGTPKDASFLLENATKVIIVPGYGMASANAQHEIVNMANILSTKYNVDVKFAIHPVAGRMPGHMNVLLAEADVNNDTVFELKDINQEFKTTDVVYVIGANDITNPLAKTDSNSTIYKMPILEVEQAKRIIFVKRSLGQGYAGIDNPLFYNNKTIMLLGDAKDVTKQIVTELE